MDSKKVGKFICELRKEKNWTQDELAEKLYVDRTMVSKWERGVYIPNTELLLKMQDLFDVSINEILFGERKTMNNNSDIDSIPLEIMKEEKKKTKKVLILSISVVLLLIISFLTYYFVNNYNSIKIYRISGENDDVVVSNGLLIYSKQKSYIRIGDIRSPKKINNIRLYFIKEKEEKNIFTGGENDTKQIYINEFNYNELYEYSDIKYILNSLKLEITFDDGNSKIITLDVIKDYANDNIIDNYKEPIGDGQIEQNNISVPKYILDNFSYNEAKKEYYRKSDNIVEEYIINQKIYIITIQKPSGEEKIFYNIKDDIVEIDLFKNDKIEEYYIYNINKSECIYGNCNKNFIEEIIKDYLYIVK